jgi:DNA-binding FrmR family transcriptional regulator
MATKTAASPATKKPGRAAKPAASGPGFDDAREMMPADKRDEALARLARATGQVQGVARMIDDGRHCTEVLQQIAAVQKALDGVGTIVLRNYLERCVTTAIEGGDPLIYDELMRVFSRYR